MRGQRSLGASAHTVAQMCAQHATCVDLSRAVAPRRRLHSLQGGRGGWALGGRHCREVVGGAVHGWYGRAFFSGKGARTTLCAVSTKSRITRVLCCCPSHSMIWVHEFWVSFLLESSQRLLTVKPLAHCHAQEEKGPARSVDSRRARSPASTCSPASGANRSAYGDSLARGRKQSVARYRRLWSLSPRGCQQAAAGACFQQHHAWKCTEAGKL